MEVSSRELVPGDVIRIQGDWVLPVDVALVKGHAVCDESGLTGEAMPVYKVALPAESDAAFVPHKGNSKNCLFAGSRVLQAGAKPSDEVVAVVVATGIWTSKGLLISKILFPSTMSFKYDEELPIVICILLVYAFLVYGTGLLLQLNNGTSSYWVSRFAFGLFTVSQIVTPLLPVALKVGQTTASGRLKDMGVLCLNPHRIAISGKVHVFCFDKTGTLTREGLDFRAVHCVAVGTDGADKTFGKLCDNVQEPGPAEETGDVGEMRRAMATCHAVSMYGDQFVGNQALLSPLSPRASPTAPLTALFVGLGGSADARGHRLESHRKGWRAAPGGARRPAPRRAHGAPAIRV